MCFLDWVFGTQEEHDLFQYGIEGEDWEPVGEDGCKQLDISEELKYTMPNYSFTLNPYIRYSEFVLNDPEIKADFEYIWRVNLSAQFDHGIFLRSDKRGDRRMRQWRS